MLFRSIEFPPIYRQRSGELLDCLTGQPWDFVQFGYAFETTPVPKLVGDGPLLRPFDGEATGGHFYALNGDAISVMYEFLLALLHGPVGDPRRGPMSPDGVFNVIKWEKPEFHRLMAYPNMGLQRKSRSDLRPRWFDQVPGLRHLADAARSAVR